MRTSSSDVSQRALTERIEHGAAGYVDRLWVHWPMGDLSSWGPMEANQEIQLVEGME